jgi:hypothetical protein
MEIDRQEACSGLRGEDPTDSTILDKDLKLCKKLAGWWRQLKGKEMKKKRI